MRWAPGNTTTNERNDHPLRFVINQEQQNVGSGHRRCLRIQCRIGHAFTAVTSTPASNEEQKGRQREAGEIPRTAEKKIGCNKPLEQTKRRKETRQTKQHMGRGEHASDDGQKHKQKRTYKNGSDN